MMPKFYKQNKKRIDPRYFPDETVIQEGNCGDLCVRRVKALLIARKTKEARKYLKKHYDKTCKFDCENPESRRRFVSSMIDKIRSKIRPEEYPLLPGRKKQSIPSTS